MDAIARKGRGAQTHAGTDTSNNSNMPAISRGDALMRDAAGEMRKEGGQRVKKQERGEREGTARTAGVPCLLAPRMKV